MRVVMMHRERMKPKYSLEDYIYEMECRSMEPSVDSEDLDVYAQLQQKEKDLILAAELGKALLEKNEELSRQNEKIAEDYSQKLEVSNEALLQLLQTAVHGNYLYFGSGLFFRNAALEVSFASLWALVACLHIEDSFDTLLD